MKLPVFLLVEMTTVGIIAGIAFFVLCAVIAFVAFKMLKKTVTMAFRMAVVGGILLLSLIISVGILIFLSGGKKSDPKKPIPTNQKTR